ncbi:MAG: hypothetical protein J6033_04015 [Lachnospiraceae bacterium]|nr:hypothetical protein [Lachnospiraceae bacterium]
MDIGFLLAGILLIPLSIRDIKEKAVTVAELVMFFLSETVMAMITFSRGGTDIVNMFIGLLPGIMVLLFSKVTGFCGAADAWVIGAVGVHLGIFNAVLILLAGLSLSAVGSVFGLIFRKISVKERVPFIPYINAGILAVGFLF